MTTKTAEATLSRDNDALREKAGAVKEAAMDLASETKKYAAHRVSDAKDTAGEWVETAKDKASEYQDNVVDYIQRNPYKAIGIALGMGFVAGLILKRR